MLIPPQVEWGPKDFFLFSHADTSEWQLGQFSWCYVDGKQAFLRSKSNQKMLMGEICANPFSISCHQIWFVFVDSLS